MRFPSGNQLSPRQKVLCAYLGPEYGKNKIDGENVIYRDLGAYDIEISGGHTKCQPINIYIWRKSDMTIVERYTNLPQDHELIKKLLDHACERYKKKEDENHE